MEFKPLQSTTCPYPKDMFGKYSEKGSKQANCSRDIENTDGRAVSFVDHIIY